MLILLRGDDRSFIKNKENYKMSTARSFINTYCLTRVIKQIIQINGTLLEKKKKSQLLPRKPHPKNKAIVDPYIVLFNFYIR